MLLCLLSWLQIVVENNLYNRKSTNLVYNHFLSLTAGDCVSARGVILEKIQNMFLSDTNHRGTKNESSVT